MKNILLVFIFIISTSFFYGQTEEYPVPVHVVKFNITNLVFLNLNVSYERIYKKRSSEIDFYKYFPLNIDGAFGPYIMGVHYKGYGIGFTRKYLIMKHGWYCGFKGTFKYKYFNNKNVLVSGKAEESDGQEWTLASNKRYAESIAATFGNIYNDEEDAACYMNFYVAIGAAVISTQTKNYNTYAPGNPNHPLPLTPIRHSNSTYFSPEFQIGLKLGLGFSFKKRPRKLTE